jgi:hypothetical protein
MASFSTQLKQ